MTTPAPRKPPPPGRLRRLLGWCAIYAIAYIPGAARLTAMWIMRSRRGRGEK